MALLGAASVSAAEVNDYDRFQLWNECRSMILMVENIDMVDDAAANSLTTEGIEIAVRSRLRAARIYSDYETGSDWPHLYINVTVARSAFSV